MLNSKQIKLLKWLDSKIQVCQNCDLFKNGRATPYWHKHSKYMIIGEGPGEEEIKVDETFVGKTGVKLWKIALDFGFKKKDFAVLNTINCRAVKLLYGKIKNGKPTEEQMDACYPWIRMYAKIIKPKKILILGAYAAGTMTGNGMNIVKRNGTLFYDNRLKVPCVLSIHPSYTLYNPEEGTEYLRDSFRIFKRLKGETYERYTEGRESTDF